MPDHSYQEQSNRKNGKRGSEDLVCPCVPLLPTLAVLLSSLVSLQKGPGICWELGIMSKGREGQEAEEQAWR